MLAVHLDQGRLGDPELAVAEPQELVELLLVGLVERGALKLWRKVNRELARFNPIVLKFRKSVLFSSDELVNVAVVKFFPQVLVLLRKIFKFGVLTVQKYGFN